MASRVATRAGIVLAVVMVLLGGLWVAAGLIAPTYLTSIIAGFAWFILASVLLGRVTKRRPDLRWPVRGTFLVTAVAAAAVFAWTSLRDETVNERVVTGVPQSQAAAQAPKHGSKPAPPRNVAVASGRFKVADEGSAKGQATVVRLAKGGRKLTLTGFAVANGPDLRVYLVPGDGTDTGDHVDLGALKGNRGDQQYTIGDRVDLGRYRTVVIWCRAFTVAFARAQLRAD